MLANPKKYRELFQSSKIDDVNQTEDLKAYLETLATHENQVKEMLSFVESERKEELELGEIKKKFELRKMQFEMRMQEAYLTVPFDGEIEFLFPYVEGEKNYIQSGMEVALLRDLRELHGQVPILDPDWRNNRLGKSLFIQFFGIKMEKKFFWFFLLASFPFLTFLYKFASNSKNKTKTR